MTTPQTNAEITEKWGRPLVALVCDTCDWNYLVASLPSRMQCPHCFTGTLETFELDADKFPTVAPPEEILPFRVSKPDIPKLLPRFVEDIPFPSLDLNPITFNQRARKVYLPIWLVDGTVKAQWQVEVGYPYQVESYESRYSNGQWQSRQVKETRTEWEKRVGQLRRSYDNVTAPALDEHNTLVQYLGTFNEVPIRAYTPDSIDGVFVRLPNRSPEDVLPYAQEGFRERAEVDIKDATEASSLRGFQWQAGYQNLHWTKRLIPVVMSYYLDDDKQARMVLINAVTGHIAGEKRASMRRARRFTFIGFAIAALIASVAISIILADPTLDDIAALLALVASGVGFGALIPAFRVWRFNDAQEKWGTYS
ncbi:MAG: hypothetical protein AAFR81_13930 [Chloroflexota bacterium]